MNSQQSGNQTQATNQPPRSRWKFILWISFFIVFLSLLGILERDFLGSVLEWIVKNILTPERDSFIAHLWITSILWILVGLTGIFWIVGLLLWIRGKVNAGCDYIITHWLPGITKKTLILIVATILVIGTLLYILLPSILTMIVEGLLGSILLLYIAIMQHNFNKQQVATKKTDDETLLKRELTRESWEEYRDINTSVLEYRSDYPSPPKKGDMIDEDRKRKRGDLQRKIRTAHTRLISEHKGFLLILLRDLRLINKIDPEIKLAGMNFSSLDFSESPEDFSGCNFRKIKLMLSNFSRSTLVNSDLSFADMTGVILTNTDITKAILDKAIYLDEQLSDVAPSIEVTLKDGQHKDLPLQP